MKIRINTSQMKNFCRTVLLTGIFFFGVLVAYNSMNLAEEIKNKMIIVFLASIVMFILNFKKGKHRNTYLIKCSYIFCLVVLLSSLGRADSTFMLAAILGAASIFVMKKAFESYNDNVYLSICWAMFFAAILALYRYSVSAFNSQGVIIAFFGIMLLNMLCIKRTKKISLFVVCVIVEIVLLALTKSRTSMLAFLVVAIITYCYLFMQKVTVKNILIIFAGVCVLLVLHNYLEQFFVRIFFEKWGNTDITSSRTLIWGYILQNRSILGHGVNHMNGGDAHNAFMQVLGVYGIPACIAFIILIVSIFVKLAKCKYRIIYLNLFVGWLIVAMFENLDIFSSRMIPVTILFLMHIVMLNNENSWTKKENNL